MAVNKPLPLKKCWPRSTTDYVVFSPQWVKVLINQALFNSLMVQEIMLALCLLITVRCQDICRHHEGSQITSLTIVYSTVNSDADQRKHQSSASLAFVRGIHRGPVNSPHKWPVTRKMFPFDGVIMFCYTYFLWSSYFNLENSFASKIGYLYSTRIPFQSKDSCLERRAPSEYKDSLSQIWGFPCWR